MMRTLLLLCLALASALSQTTTQPHHNVIRLVGDGDDPRQGNVYVVNEDSYYGPVCDDYWDINDAHVACRQLGFAGAIRATTDSEFGRVPDKFAMDDVHCTGEEGNLQDCRHATTDNCISMEGAGVVCECKCSLLPVEDHCD